MAHELAMPWLGPTVSSATIATWLVADGSHVLAGQPIVVIDAAGAPTEVGSRAEGTIEIRIEAGAVAPSGEVIAIVHDASPDDPGPVHGEPDDGMHATPLIGEAVPAAAGDVPDSRGRHGRILASPRARALARDEGIDLSQVDGQGPGGRIVHDDVRRVADELARRREVEAARIAEAERAVEQARLDAERREAARVAAAEAAEAQAAILAREHADRAMRDEHATNTGEPSDVDDQAVPATTAARQLADFLGVDLDEVPRSAGRDVTREDVGAWVRLRLSEATVAPGRVDATTHPATRPTAPDDGLLQEPVDVVVPSDRRTEIARRVHTSLRDMAQLTLTVDADMTAVNAERERRRRAGEIVPGYTAWVVAAAAQSVADHPYINSQLTPDGLAVLPDVHLGVTVALDAGLVVPVIEHADLRAVEEIHQLLAELASRARTDRLEPTDLDRATFSVTALGMFGVDVFTPVIHPPNTAVLGVGRLRSATAWRDSRPVETTVMTLSLTWDHRAYDSAPAAEFARTIVRRLETPAELV